MATTNRRRLRLSASICALVVGVLIVGVASELTKTKSWSRRDLLVEGTWNEVTNDWPLEEREFFVATEKGHHYVQTKLPQDLKRDLEVTFEYYYSYSKTMPVVQLTPCRENIFLFDSMDDTKNKWARHSYRVKHTDCNVRNELGYNAILHDTGDVFAWRMIEIKEVESGPIEADPVRTNPSNIKLNERPTGAKNEDKVQQQKQSETEKSVEQASELVAGGNEKGVTQKKADDKGTRDDVDPTDLLEPMVESNLIPNQPQKRPEDTKGQDEPNQKTSSSEAKSGQQSSKSKVISAGEKDQKETEELKIFGADNSKEPKEEQKSSESKGSGASESKPTSAENKTPERVPEKSTGKATDNVENKRARVVQTELYQRASDDFEEGRPVFRAIRDASKSSGKLHERVCRPSSCNRQLFELSTFSLIIGGLPELSNTDKQKLSSQSAYFVNLRNQPLRLKLQGEEESLDDVDSCVHLELYMEENAEIQFLLEDETEENKNGKLLEVIRRKPGDSAAAHWDKFSRCISDYMPRYAPRLSQLKRRGNWLSFVLKPIGALKPGRMAVLIDRKQSGSFKELYPVQSFLPDLKGISAGTLNKYWTLDRDGLDKPQVDLRQATSGGGNVLHISQIDPNQDSFDLTSRWLQIKDAEILGQPLMFVYKAERADWIERIDVQYQRAGDSAEDWLTQVAYKASGKLVTATNATTWDSAAGAASSKKIDLPIRLKGADSSEFRLRLRHHLRQAAHGASPSSSSYTPLNRHLSLDLTSLAFADVCSYSRPYCQNEAPCRPTGSATAECLCETGYSGPFCEVVRPCEVLHEVSGGTAPTTVAGVSTSRVSGHDLCKSMGSRCVEQLPVLRCEWENDMFYQCKKMFKFDSTGAVVSSLTGASLSGGAQNGSVPHLAPTDCSWESFNVQDLLQPGESPADVPLDELFKRLRTENRSQAEKIIILSVFLVALSVFAVVLIGSMIMRLRVSSGRLRKSQNEVHELSRRRQVLPMPSNSSRPGSGPHAVGRSGALAYNNSAFDVEL